MSDPFGDRPVPRGALIGAAALIGFTMLSVTAARLGGLEPTQVQPGELVDSRELVFEDRSDGSVAVYDARQEKVVVVLESGTNGFIRGVLRGFARERKLQGVGRDLPFYLAQWDDGHLSIEDPSTGRKVELDAFGPTNAGAFARLLKPKIGTPASSIQSPTNHWRTRPRDRSELANVSPRRTQ